MRFLVVHSHVAVEVPRLRKAHMAESTFVWFLPSVGPDVLSKCRAVSKPLELRERRRDGLKRERLKQ